MSKRQRPQTKVGGSIGDSAKHKLDGMDNLMDKNLAKVKLFSFFMAQRSGLCRRMKLRNEKRTKEREKEKKEKRKKRKRKRKRKRIIIRTISLVVSIGEFFVSVLVVSQEEVGLREKHHRYRYNGNKDQ